MKTIFFIITSLKHKGGCERVACNLANLFIKEFGYTVYILNRDTEYKQVAYHLNHEIKLLCLNGNLLEFYKKIQKNINFINPDYIIVYNMGRLSLLTSFLKKNKSKVFSFEHIAYTSRPFLIRVLNKIIAFRFDKFITLTTQDLKFYNKKKCVVIPNISSFPISQKDYSKNSYKIIAIGRLDYQKNFQALLLAWLKIQNQLSLNWHLDIYGIGEEEIKLKNIIQKNGIKNVFLKGNKHDMEKIYEQASFLVMSSRFEGLPMVLIEAQSFGLPIISFDCPFGPKEIVTNGEDGILVENQNIDLLAKYILELSNSLEKRIKFSENAKIKAQKFTKEKILELWKQILI